MRSQLIEEWVEVQEFPSYSVSTLGRVKHNHTDRIKEPARNQQGILMVNFSVRGMQQVRSLPLLVARAFLSREEIPEHFDTPIQLDGDRTNCRVDNLTWRPRWFAVRYYQQFHRPEFGVPGFKIPIGCVETGGIFNNTWDAAREYGMLEKDILMEVSNGRPVPLQMYHFEFLDD